MSETPNQQEPRPPIATLGMNFSESFIRRPIATSLLMVGFAVFGIMAYQALPVSDLPNVDFPTLTVSASLPGADPATMASAVATPLERQFTTIAGIDSMTSVNSQGSTQITLQFDLDRKIEGAAVDVQTAIAAAMPLLPPGLPAPPSFRKVNPADSPILFLTLSSKSLPMNKVDEYAQTTIAQRLSMIPGVAQAPACAACAGRIEGRRVTRTLAHGHGGDVDLGHGRLRRGSGSMPIMRRPESRVTRP